MQGLLRDLFAGLFDLAGFCRGGARLFVPKKKHSNLRIELLTNRICLYFGLVGEVLS